MTRQSQDALKRDVFGRNLSYLKSCLPQPTNIESIDLYSHELESGYTPLHATLKLGYLRDSFRLYKHWKDEMEFLSHKFGGHIMNQTDREGLTPLELYDMELQGPTARYPNALGYRINDDDSLVKWGTYSQESNSQGPYVLTWGSNVNYQLGTGTKDDRQNMFQLAITQLESNGYLPSSENFKQIFIRRYHSLLLTTNNNIYVCGTGSRGRLGNGTSESDEPTFTQVLDLEDVDVRMISTSDHHSLVLTSDHSVYSWGWNAYGQLGHTSNRRIEEKNINKVAISSAKRIGFLDGEDISFVACSKLHSCAATRSGHVLMWGLNLGQMGGSKPVHSTSDVQYHNEDGYIVRTPMIVKLSNCEIEQIVCTELATFIRTKGNSLHILSNYSIRTFKIPLPRSRAFKEVDTFDHFTPREVPSEVVDMKCSNRFGNKICFRYSCGRVGIISIKDETVRMWSKMSNSLPVSLYWTPNLKGRKCLDFDVSAQGKIIICTIGGEVFTIDGVNSRPEKIYSSKLVTGRALSVSCDSSFGSFAIIKKEINGIPMIYPKDSLYFDFSQYSPLKGKRRSRKGMIWGIMNEPKMQHTDYLSSQKLANDLETEDKPLEVERIKSIGSSLADFEHSKITELSQEAVLDEANFDVVFISGYTKTPICYCHKLVLKNRCTSFIEKLTKSGHYESKNCFHKFTFECGIADKCWRINIWAEKDPTETLLQLTHFLYTDERDFGQNTSRLLFELVDNSHHLAKLSVTLQELVRKRNNENCVDSSDVAIIVADGVLKAHSLILSTRSAFFQAILSKDWVSADKNGIKTINLEHIEFANMQNMEFILNYFYGMEYEEICSSLDMGCFGEYLQFFLETLELTDIFSLEGFKNFLESVVAKYITGETVIPILINATYSNCRLLSFTCCSYLCTHVGILFSRENIELVNQYFDHGLWCLLEEVLIDMRNHSVKQQCKPWYANVSFDWISLFRNNLKAFNERFMDSKHSFIPTFDLKPPVTEQKSRTKSSNRRASITHTQNKNRQSSSSSFTGEKSFTRRPSHLEEKKTVCQDRTDDTAIDDTDDFVEVIKKPKRRTSSQVAKLLPDQKSGDHFEGSDHRDCSSKVVIHSNADDCSSSLPSLLPSSGNTDSGSVMESESSSAKMSGTFKKVSQKQRKKIVVTDDKTFDEHVWKKTSWGSRISTTHSHNSVASSKPSLPSLYDRNSSSTLNLSKKEKKKSKQLAPNTEFVSHGNMGGISPYLQKTAIAQASLAKAPLASPKLTLEERVAAQEFEKWFAEQSENVQKQLSKKKNKSLARELDVVYNAAQSLPDFLAHSGEKPKKHKKRLKLKFQSKQAQDSSS